MGKIVYEDKAHQQTMGAMLERTRQKMQRVVDEWNALDMTACGDTSRLYELVHNPDIPYREGINKLQIKPDEVTEAQWKKHIDKLRIPAGSGLFEAAEQAKADLYSDREMMLFDMKDGKVILSPNARSYIHSRTVTADSPAQEEFAAKYLDFVNLFNDLNESTRGRMLTENIEGWAKIFKTPVRFVNGDYSVNPSNSFLSEALPRLR